MKFKCLSCGNQFESDNSNLSVCPNCHDNHVKRVTGGGIGPFCVGGVFILSCMLGYFVTDLIVDDNKSVSVVSSSKIQLEKTAQDSVSSIMTRGEKQTQNDSVTEAHSGEQKNDTPTQSQTNEINVTNASSDLIADLQSQSKKEVEKKDEKKKQKEEAAKPVDTKRLIGESEKALKSANYKALGKATIIIDNPQNGDGGATDRGTPHNRLKMGTWNDFKVVSVAVAADGKTITEVHIVVDYPEGDE